MDKTDSLCQLVLGNSRLSYRELSRANQLTQKMPFLTILFVFFFHQDVNKNLNAAVSIDKLKREKK